MIRHTTIFQTAPDRGAAAACQLKRALDVAATMSPLVRTSSAAIAVPPDSSVPAASAPVFGSVIQTLEFATRADADAYPASAEHVALQAATNDVVAQAMAIDCVVPAKPFAPPRIAVVGATGNLGRRIVRQALSHDIAVRAFVRHEASVADVDARSDVRVRDLFDIGAEDLAGIDVLVSAFGSGFAADPDVNERACVHYAALARAAGVRIVAVTGSGCLFRDKARTQHVYEREGYPARLAPISAAATRGLARLDAIHDVAWTLVCPGLVFDADGPATGAWSLDLSRIVHLDDRGESYATYEDVAAAMLAIACKGGCERELVTVSSPSSVREGLSGDTAPCVAKA